MEKKIEISLKTLLYLLGTAILLWLSYQLRQIILALIISVILMSAFNPSVKKLESKKIPRWLAILFIYLVLFLILGLSLWGIIPHLVDQTTKLLSQLPELFSKAKLLGIDEKSIASQLSQLTSLPANIVKLLFGLFSNILQVFVLAVFTFYLLLERKNLNRYLADLFGEAKERKIAQIIDKIEENLGNWVRGELVLMLIVGLLNYLGFLIIGIEYALPLALLAFLFEIVPNIGPVLAALPAVLIAFSISPFHALATAGWCFFVQQLENSLLVPRIMNRMTGINPLISILAIAAGIKIGGVGGGLLAIPVYIVVQTILKETKPFNKSGLKARKPDSV